MLYSRKTDNHWLAKSLEGDTVVMVNMIEGGVTMRVSLKDFENAVNSNALVVKEYESKLLQLHNIETKREVKEKIKKK